MKKWKGTLFLLFVAVSIIVAFVAIYPERAKQEKTIREATDATWDRAAQEVSYSELGASAEGVAMQKALSYRAKRKAHTEVYKRNPWIGWVILGGPVVVIVAGTFLAIFLKKRGLSGPRWNGKVSASPFWQCPKCRGVLRKAGLGVAWFPGEDLSKVLGTATCGACAASYPQAEVYGGRYDV